MHFQTGQKKRGEHHYIKYAQLQAISDFRKIKMWRKTHFRMEELQEAFPIWLFAGLSLWGLEQRLSYASFHLWSLAQ